MSNTAFPYFPSSSRVWLYPCKQQFTPEQESDLQHTFETFVAQWKSHDKPVKGNFEIFGHSILVIVADEDFESPSGCSIDSCVRLVKEFSEKHSLDMFNRTGIYVLNDHSIKIYTPKEAEEALNNGELLPESRCLNLQVNNLEGFIKEFVQPFSVNWLGKKLCNTTTA